MIRWEQLENRDWQGFSGELSVASVVRDPDAEQERWLWKIKGLKRPKGWRKPIGPRATWLDARRSADAYWERWLAAASLRRTSSGSRCRVSRGRSEQSTSPVSTKR